MLTFVCFVAALLNLRHHISAVPTEPSDPFQKCQFSQYLLEDQVVDWYNSVQGHGWLEGCVNDSLVEEVFDIELVVKYAYGELSVHNTLLPKLPENAATRNVILHGVTPIGVWGGCSQLEKLDILSPINLTLISSDWLASCSRLNELIFTGLTVTEARTILDTVATVRSVEFRGIVEIESISERPIFPSARGAHQWIIELDMSLSLSTEMSANNTFRPELSESFVRQLSLLPRLEKFRVYNFDGLDWCASANNSSLIFPSLKELWIPGFGTNSFCFRELRVAPNLTHIALNVIKLQFSELSCTCAPQIHVDFVDTVIFYREDYLMLSDCKEPRKSNVVLDLKQGVVCDCGQSLWLTRALNEGLVTLPSVTCTDGSQLEDQSCDWLYCERVTCNTPCVCCADGNNSVIADCRDAHVTAIPEEVLRLSNLTELLIPHSNLTAIPEKFPDSLIFIDFYGNDLLRIVEASRIKSLFAVPERMVRLAANPIVCTCDNQLVIKELQLCYKQIEDYHDMVCAGESLEVGNVDAVKLCAERDRSANVLVTVTVALIVTAAALVTGVLCYYRRHIKIFLFARGWCLCCINEEELDADRRYDVFLSYCYSDESFVVSELLSKLDQHYTVCIHFRDWNPGDMIPSQIWNSVEQSRRTIVVLSRNFIKSLWGVLEFRSAYVSGLTEGRVRVVMVVIDDVLEKDELQGELRAYVRLNTYVKWGDPWFWDKLRFALPHRPVTQPERERDDAADFVVNYLVVESGTVKILALSDAENDNSEKIEETSKAVDKTVNDTTEKIKGKPEVVNNTATANETFQSETSNADSRITSVENIELVTNVSVY